MNSNFSFEKLLRDDMEVPSECWNRSSWHSIWEVDEDEDKNDERRDERRRGGAIRMLE